MSCQSMLAYFVYENGLYNVFFLDYDLRMERSYHTIETAYKKAVDTLGRFIVRYNHAHISDYEMQTVSIDNLTAYKNGFLSVVRVDDLQIYENEYMSETVECNIRISEDMKELIHRKFPDIILSEAIVKTLNMLIDDTDK